MVRSWIRTVFILAMAVSLGSALAAAFGPPALASPGHSSALIRGRDLPQASGAVIGGNLLAVSAASPTDAWAVGYKCSNAICSPPNLSFSTLIEHWNGRTWTRVPSPNPEPSTGGDQLTGVSAVSASDAWAVGAKNCAAISPASCDLNGHELDGEALILHWDGRKWTEVPSPGRAAGAGPLTGVTALSATNAWATGASPILHWNGRRWTRVPGPSVGFDGVSAASAADAWAAGWYIPSPGSPLSTLLARWNGRTWTRVPSPSPGFNGSALFGVSTVVPADAWAVGWYSVFGPALNLILRWNGRKWAQVASPDPGTEVNQLNGVSAISATDAWAVGQYASGTGVFGRTLILRWNGRKWTRVASPNPDPSQTFNELLGVSTVSPTSAFAVGTTINQTTGVSTSLAARWNGKNWS
jgi:hypothetical protein